MRPRSDQCLLTIIITCTFCIFLSLIIDIAVDPERDAKNALNRLADNYYTEYLYPSVLGRYLNEPATILSYYSESGFPMVHLRQLLHFNNDAYYSESKYLTTSVYSCDENATLVKFTPVAPFGPRDYIADFTYSCQTAQAL